MSEKWSSFIELNGLYLSVSFLTNIPCNVKIFGRMKGFNPERPSGGRFPEISLLEEYYRQALIMARTFARGLGFSEERYMATLPPFPELPPVYEELGLTVPLLIETRFPWFDIAHTREIILSGKILDSIYYKTLVNWENRIDLSKGPIAVWVQDGNRFINRTSQDVRAELWDKVEYQEYRAGDVFGGIALWLVRPDMIRGKHWDLTGNRITGSMYIPSLSCFDQPKLHAWEVDMNTGPNGRALVYGAKIEI